ncbi:MAG TPA: MFS transporter [Thermoplasmatales archaeon]|nr:MFS transporter [Thermoplasmatales archaeon]
MQQQKQYLRILLKDIGRNILLLGFVSFLNDMSSEIIMPILPLFIVSLGGNEVILGLIGGLRESLSSLLKVASGYVSDKAGKRKPFVAIGYSVSAFFKLLLGFSTMWQHILLFSSFERVGKGLRTAPRDAIIADSLPEKKGKGFGVHRALDTLGAILGAILAFIFLWYIGLGYRMILLFAASLSLLSLIPLFWVKEKRKKKTTALFHLTLRNLPKSLKMFILIAAIFSLANISYMFFIRRAQLLFTGTSAVAMPVFLYVVFNIFYAAFAIPFGTLSDRFGRKKILITGYILFSLVCLGFALMNTFTSFILLFALYGLVYAIVDGNQRAFVSDLSNKNIRATSLGAFHTTIGLTALPAGLIAGVLWKNFSYSAPFLYASIMSVFAATTMFLLIKSESGKS